jgi:hypothetical protein
VLTNKLVTLCWQECKIKVTFPAVWPRNFILFAFLKFFSKDIIRNKDRNFYTGIFVIRTFIKDENLNPSEKSNNKDFVI